MSFDKKVRYRNNNNMIEKMQIYETRVKNYPTPYDSSFLLL